MTKRQVSTNPVTLQRIAFAAVVLFGLVMTYAIHITNQTVADVKASHYNQTLQGIQEANVSSANN